MRPKEYVSRRVGTSRTGPAFPVSSGRIAGNTGRSPGSSVAATGNNPGLVRMGAATGPSPHRRRSTRSTRPRPSFSRRLRHDTGRPHPNKPIAAAASCPARHPPPRHAFAARTTRSAGSVLTVASKTHNTRNGRPRPTPGRARLRREASQSASRSRNSASPAAVTPRQPVSVVHTGPFDHSSAGAIRSTLFLPVFHLAAP